MRRAIVRTTPLVHCLTNPLAMAFSANALLAIGASPAMVEAQQEVAGFAARAANVLINTGTLHDGRLPAMRAAAQAACAAGKPWVLDPVGVGEVLSYRTDFVRELLGYRPAVIRGNAAEIVFLAGGQARLRGVDSLETSETARAAAEALAGARQCVVVVTGARDFISDGRETLYTTGGDVRQTRVTACGCTLSALVAAFVAHHPPLQGAAAACAWMKKAGDVAQSAQGMGQFAQMLWDALTWERYENL